MVILVLKSKGKELHWQNGGKEIKNSIFLLI